MLENILKQLAKQATKRSKSDQKLADIVLSNPKEVIHWAIATLAREAQVSEPTVNRFCRKLGCAGYPDFKMRLAQEVFSSNQLFVKNIDSSDDSSAIMGKILSTLQDSIATIPSSTSTETIDRCAALISRCRSLYFFGVGASGPVALDAQHKFCRFGLPVVAHIDSVNQRMLSSTLGEKDVAVFISYTGRTNDIVENAKVASQSDATIIGITRAGSPLAKQCDYVINAVTSEDTELFTPMTSRIIHLVLIDILATSVALELGESVESNLNAVKISLHSTRLADD